MHIHSHFGVYALIRNEAGHILVIKKARGPYTGMFDLPGGTPEENELLEETLHREVMEETACTVISSRQLGAVSARFEYEKDGQPRTLRHLGVLYACTVSGTPSTGADGHDSHGCVWLEPTPANLQNATPFTAMALQLDAK